MANKKCPDCEAALRLLNKHLSGRKYTNLDDALRNLLQAFVTLRDNEADRIADYEAGA